MNKLVKPVIRQKRVDFAVKAFKKLVQYRTILRNHSKIANSPLPKHKDKKHQQLVADWLVNVQNAQNELAKVEKRLNANEFKEYEKLCRGI
jgi:hypothetical protein